MSNEEQPLLGRDLGRDCVDSGKDAGGRPPFRSAAGEVDAEAQAPKDAGYVTYGVFFLVGIGMLFPWNVFITATGYYDFVFEGTSFENNYNNWIGIAYNLANLGGLCALLYSSSRGWDRRFSTVHRVNAGFYVGVAVFLFVTATIYVSIDPEAYFAITLLCVILCGMMTALIQNGIFGISSKFPSTYNASIMTGQTLAGTLVSVVAILTTLVKDPGAVADLAAERLSAFMYFVVAVVILAACVAAFWYVQRLPFYKHHYGGGKVASTQAAGEERKEGEDSDDDNDHSSVGVINEEEGNIEAAVEETSTYIGVAKRVWDLGLAVFYGFVVTLAVFPTLVQRVQSTTESDARIFGDLFVPWVFLLFNLGDLTGRVLADFLPVVKHNYLLMVSLLRSVFFPLVLLSNIKFTDIDGNDLPLSLPALLTSDAVWWLIVYMLGTTGGYVASLSMMYGPSRVTAGHEKEKAGIIMVNFLVWGLFAGSMSSFLLYGILCNCNPFI